MKLAPQGATYITYSELTILNGRKMGAKKRVLAVILSVVVVFSGSALLDKDNAAYGWWHDNNYNGIALNYSYPIAYHLFSGFGAGTKVGQRNTVAQWNSAVALNRSLLSIHPVEHNTNIGYPYNNFISTIYGVKDNKADYLAKNSNFCWPQTLPLVHIVYESDINYNHIYKFSNSAVPGQFDAETVFLHQVGHTVGLANSTVTSLVMYIGIAANKLKRTLTPTDRSLAHYRYHR